MNAAGPVPRVATRLLRSLAVAMVAFTIAGCGGGPQEGGGEQAPPGFPTPVRRQGDAARPPRSPEYGVHAFLWWRQEDAERDLLLVKDMGFTWVKQGFGWRDIELAKGEFDWDHTDPIVSKVQEYGGLDLLARVDSPPVWAQAGNCSLQGPPRALEDFADFLTALATRYRGRIRAYEIWNEPNLAREWCDESPDPAAYVRLLAVAYKAVKAADPSALVISAGLAPTGDHPPVAIPDTDYLVAMYEAMNRSSAGHFDVLGVHAAGYAAPPETSPEQAAANLAFGGERFFTFRHVEELRAIQERFGDGDTRVAVLEMGWSTDTVHEDYAWHAVTAAQQADYLVRAYQYAAKNWQPWIGPMITIFLCNADWTPADEQYFWCINNPDGSPRPAFEALKAMTKETG